MEAFLGRKSGSLVDLLRQYGAGVKQRLGLLAEDPAEFARGALLDVVPNYQEAQAAQARLMGGQVDPQQYGRYVDKMRDISGLLASIKVYHGSPHKFDKFDLSKMGAGEGAQTYGHGGYLAESKDVAKSYRERLSKPGAGYLYEANLRWPDAASEAADPMGPQHFLDWDKPLSEQSDFVRKAMSKLGISPITYEEMADAASKGVRYENLLTSTGKVDPHLSVSDIFRKLAGPRKLSLFGGHNFNHNATERQATEMLRSAGIPGTRYLDAGSRADGVGTSSYVVFDDALIELLTRNGVPVKK